MPASPGYNLRHEWFCQRWQKKLELRTLCELESDTIPIGWGPAAR